MDDMNLITPKIKQAINEAINKAFLKLGIRWFISLLLVIILLVYLGRIWVDTIVAQNIDKYKSELEKQSQKYLEVWKIQRQLTFDFIEFLETKIFTNPNLSSEKKEVMAQLNQFYGKLYLVLDTSILNKVNALLTGTVSPTQRFYLYREIRKQLLKTLQNKEINDNECPYISSDVEKVATTEGSKKPKSFEELKEIYGFVEKGDKQNTYKGLPCFEAK